MKKTVPNLSTASQPPLRRSKGKQRPVTTGMNTSALDMAILGAVLALTSSKVGSANAYGNSVPHAENVGAATPESFGLALNALSGASAEVMVLAALAENIHRDL